jgi:hypothetical protein
MSSQKDDEPGFGSAGGLWEPNSPASACWDTVYRFLTQHHPELEGDTALREL